MMHARHAIQQIIVSNLNGMRGDWRLVWEDNFGDIECTQEDVLILCKAHTHIVEIARVSIFNQLNSSYCMA